MDLITLLALAAGIGVLFEGVVGLVMTLGAVWDGIASRLDRHGAAR